MIRVICIRHSTTAGFKLTKLFGIYDFSVEKDSGKVLIIIMYCFIIVIYHTMSTLYLQNWMAFSKLHKPLFTEHGSVKFPNTNPPTDENNNAYCQVK